MTFAHVAIRLSFMQLVDASLVKLKCFHFFLFLRIKTKRRDVDEMNAARCLKLNDLNLFVQFVFKKQHLFETFCAY